MKKLSKLSFLFVAFIMLAQIFLPTLSYAFLFSSNGKYNAPNNKVILSGQTDRPDRYQIDNNYENIPEQFVIKIKDAENSSSYYCLRGGLGFGNAEDENQVNGTSIEYSYMADLINKNEVKSNLTYLDENSYNAICWIADNMYVSTAENAEELKSKLLTKAGISGDMLDEDIEVVEQIALWYFTNADKANDFISSFVIPLADTAENDALAGVYLKVNNASLNDNARKAKINKLYRYFIENAQTGNYYLGENIQVPNLSLNKSLTSTIEKTTVAGSSAYLIGPFKVDKTAGNIDYLANFTCKINGEETSREFSTSTNPPAIIALVDENGNVLSANDAVNAEKFYARILNNVININTINSFELDFSYSYNYYKTIATVWTAGAEDQPVLKVEKEKIEDAKEDLINVNAPEKEFDLSLRKFITKINGVALTGENDRTPKIYLEELRNKTNTTATYVHPKNPIYLKRGDRIVYTIRIYNEGEIDGYATEITDYLCDDLEFISPLESEINQEYEWEQDAQNPQIIRTAKLAGTKLNAYDLELTEEDAIRNGLVWQPAEDGTDGLYYADLQIECKIKDSANVNITLPNVAEITDDFNEEGDIPDRDSEPESLRDDNIRDYENNPWYEDDDDYERVIIEPDVVFDLSLRKYITKVNDVDVTNTREPEIDFEALDAGTSKTAYYAHRKDPVVVEIGDIVTYNITIYNEGEQKGRATKVVDQLPTGLKFQEVISGNYELQSYSEETNKLVLKEKETNTNLDAKDEGRPLDSTTIALKCQVTATVSNKDQVLTNIAWILEEYNAETNTTITNQPKLDRDSEPETAPDNYTADDLNTENIGYTGNNNKEDLTDNNNYYKGEQDDDDFEKVIIKAKYFDLSLRKYIHSINENVLEGEDSRVPKIDTESLQDGTTATYIHPKNPLKVKQGDIITYKLRVYNEGEIDGYASEIKDYLPSGLGFINDENINPNWLITSAPEDIKTKTIEGKEIVYSEEGKELEITNFSLKDEIIKKYGLEAEDGDLWQQSTNDENDGLFYQEVEITCIVLADNTYEGTLKNIAEISQDKAVDDNGTELPIEDRDSEVENVWEDGKHSPGTEENGYTPGEQDDDDFEPVELKYFDLALRKFITGVNDEEVTSRIPEFTGEIDEYGNYIYAHPKDPVYVIDKDIVTYTIRIFNEGRIDGYAEEIEDDIPEGLIFLPKSDLNQEYRWQMYRPAEEDEDLEGQNTIIRNNKIFVETDDVEKATIIRTDYLSSAQEEETGRDNLILAFDKNTMESPDFRDVKVQFKVLQSDIPEDTDGIIINKAHITEDSDDDEDSVPDKWNDNEDDQDIEKIYVQEFDLALYKWVTKTIVTVDGKTTVTETGFKPNVGLTEGEGENYRENSEPEPVAAVTIDKKKLNKTVVKFEYNIKVVNEGDIAGFATQITDYIPEGLEFIAEDNPLWTIGEKDGTITTRALEGVLLEPGKSATIPVVFTWKKSANNLGLKTNVAAITEDYNDKGVEDIDSTPGNEERPDYDKEQEDDDDFALVILQLKTGSEVTYIGLVLAIITVISLGTVTIKKYVL